LSEKESPVTLSPHPRSTMNDIAYGINERLLSIYVPAADFIDIFLKRGEIGMNNFIA